MKQKTRNNQETVFPEYSSEIISELMEEYGIGESTEEILNKWKVGEETRSRKIANLLRDLTQGKIASEDLPSELQRKLSLPKPKALSLAKDLQEKILAFTKEGIPESATLLVKKKEKAKTKDIYREPTN